MSLNYQSAIKGYCYIIANNREVVECTEVKRAAGFVTLRFHNIGGIRLRESRAFGSEIETKEYLREIKDDAFIETL